MIVESKYIYNWMHRIRKLRFRRPQENPFERHICALKMLCKWRPKGIRLHRETAHNPREWSTRLSYKCLLWTKCTTNGFEMTSTSLIGTPLFCGRRPLVCALRISASLYHSIQFSTLMTYFCWNSPKSC